MRLRQGLSSGTATMRFLPSRGKVPLADQDLKIHLSTSQQVYEVDYCLRLPLEKKQYIVSYSVSFDRPSSTRCDVHFRFLLLSCPRK